jgi:carboxyl-terminal processing protease
MRFGREPFIGRWRSRGYGWLLEVTPGGFSMGDETRFGEVPIEQGQGDDFRRAFDPVVLESPDVLRLRRRGDVTDYWFDRRSDAAMRPAPTSDDPVKNFDVLADCFDQHYAFFGLRGVDWPPRRGAFRVKAAACRDDTALLDLFEALIGPLRDSHVSLTSPIRNIGVDSPVADRKLAVPAAFGARPWSEGRDAYTRALRKGFNALFLDGRGRSSANGTVLWGEAAPGIGYLAVLGEFGHAETARARAAQDLPREAVEAAGFLADEIRELNRILDQAADALAGMKAVIVDVRVNYGGYDRLALEVAGRFTDQPRVAYRKKTWTNRGIVAEQAIEVTPNPGPSLAHLPTYLLTSRQTASAGEILVFAMRACPNVVQVGEPTLGILSDNLYKRLPNGWELSLSNELYLAPDGALYEASGIPPAVEAPVFDPADVRGGLRLAVDCAVALANAR